MRKKQAGYVQQIHIQEAENQMRQSHKRQKNRVRKLQKKNIANNSSLGLESKHRSPQSNLQFSDYCLEQIPSYKQDQNKHEGRQEENVYQNISNDYGARELQILSRKKISNYRFIMTQIRELIKIKKWEIIMEQKKEIRGKILKLQNQCRKMKLQNRRNSSNKNILPYHQLNIRQASKQQNQRLNSLSQRKKLFSSHKFSIRNSSQWIELKHKKCFSNFQFCGSFEEEKKRILLFRIEMLKNYIESSKNFYEEKIRYLSIETEILLNEVHLTMSEIDKNSKVLKPQSLRISDFRINSLLQSTKKKKDLKDSKDSKDFTFYNPKGSKLKKATNQNEGIQSQKKITQKKINVSPLKPIHKISLPHCI